MDEQEYIRQEYKKGTPTKVIARNLGISSNAVQKRATRDIDCPPHGGFFDNGKIVSDKRREEMRDVTPAERSRIERLLEKEGYRPRWGIAWAHLEDNGIKTTVLLKNPEEDKRNDEEKAQFLEEIKKYAPKYRKPKYPKITNGHMKLIDVADLHISKYAIARNGTVAYDTQTAVERAHAAVEAMLAETKQYPTEKFWLPIGNDVLHVDNKNSTTTKGTHQDSIGMWWEAFRAAEQMYLAIVERLMAIAPVEVFYNMSNHDEHLGFCLAEWLEARMHNANNVTFTIEPQNDRIYKTYGKNLIGFDHGDGAKDKDLPLLMAIEAREHWSDHPNNYLFRHHLHHWSKREYLAGKDFPGVTLQYMRSPSAGDAWHVKKGFVGAPQAIDSFVFGAEYGQKIHASHVFAR